MPCLKKTTMKIVIQRVKSARVDVDGRKISSIGKGLLLLIGIEKGDDEAIAANMASKICKLRIFEDEQGKMNLDIKNVKGEVLSVSQFTLLGDIWSGNRPGFDEAGDPGQAKLIWGRFNCDIIKNGLVLREGVFGAKMEVSLVNDGPVTFVIDSNKK